MLRRSVVAFMICLCASAIAACGIKGPLRPAPLPATTPPPATTTLPSTDAPPTSSPAPPPAAPVIGPATGDKKP